MMDKSVFRLYLLGTFQIEYVDPTDEVVKSIRLPRRKVEALLAYLALYTQLHSREELATLLWGDFSDAQARASLRTSLAILRKVFGGDILLMQNDSIQLHPGFTLWVDVHAFEKAIHSLNDVESGNLQVAIDLYRGELLLDFYDDWILPERERLHALYINTLLRLTEQLRAQSEYEHAIEIARKVLEKDAANERAHQHLMFCYLASGDRQAALEQYGKAERALQDEFAAEPALETKALYLWVKQTVSEVPSSAARITNLPIPLTSFIGRKRELREVKNLLSHTRLLTLTGAGGSGKTRLSIQAATDLIDKFGHGVWWVDLAPLTDESLVPQAIAKAIGVREVSNQSLSETLTNYISTKYLLLVMDNCEHLIRTCAQISNALLSHCPNLQILATSREPLNSSGETLWQVPSLSVPEKEKLSLTDLLLSFESIRLFVERAKAVRFDFVLTDQNALAVAQICQRLDGIPLAIELAAVWIKLMTPEEITAHLDDRFNFLNQGSRVTMPRHQTLRATIDWSYDLLTAEEQILFRRLSVFAGGWTLDGAKQIAADGNVLSSNILDLLSRLVDKSLVIVEPRRQTRYRLLETLREYGLEKLRAAGELNTFRDRHLFFFLERVENSETKLRITDSIALAEVEPEHDNVRAALEWSLQHDQLIEAGLRLAGSWSWFWNMRGFWTEARKWLEAVLARSTSPAQNARAKALFQLADIKFKQSGPEGVSRLLEESLMIWRKGGDNWWTCFTLCELGWVEIYNRELAMARVHLEESIEIARKLRDSYLLGITLSGLGALLRRTDNAAAIPIIEESLALAQQEGDKGNIIVRLQHLADAQAGILNFVRASELMEEALKLAREIQDPSTTAEILHYLGDIVLLQGDVKRAHNLLKESLELSISLKLEVEVAFCLVGLAGVSATFEHGEKAAKLLGVASSYFEQLGLSISVWPNQERIYNQYIRQARAQLDENAFALAWSVGWKMPLQQAVEYALSDQE